ncbi:hypothetical protein HDE_02425 [Halotydeus destructor]|nr:hypothetical protein HDE_02425 [Halotydeus destructor]
MSASSGEEDEQFIEYDPALVKHYSSGGWIYAYGQRYTWRASHQKKDETKKELLVVDDHRFHRSRKERDTQLWYCYYNGRYEKCPVRAATVGKKLMDRVETENHTHLPGQPKTRKSEIPQREETELGQDTSPNHQTCSTPVTQLTTSNGENRKPAQKRSAVNDGASTSRQSDDSSPNKMEKVSSVHDSNVSKERPSNHVPEDSLSEDAKTLQEMAGPACSKINRAIQLVSKKDEQLKILKEEISKLQERFQSKAKENSVQSKKLESLTEDNSKQKQNLVQISEEKSKLEEKLKHLKKLYSAVKMVLAD